MEKRVTFFRILTLNQFARLTKKCCRIDSTLIYVVQVYEKLYAYLQRSDQPDSVKGSLNAGSVMKLSSVRLRRKLSKSSIS